MGYAFINRLWFRVPGIIIEDGGLQQVNSDHDAMLMTELVPGYGEIEVFVEHIVEEPIINSDLEDVDDDYNDQNANNNDADNSDADNSDADNSNDDSWDSVEDDEQPEIMGAGVLHSDYESEVLYSDGQGLTESDGNNAEVEANADVESSAGVYGRRPRVESRRPAFPIFRPVARAKDIRFELGMLFTSTKQFKEAIIEYAVEGGWGIRFVKNDKVRVRAICQEGCKFIAFLAKLPRELTFQLKTLQLEHSCSRCFKNPKMTTKFLAKKLVGRVKDQPDIKLRSIQKKVRKKYVTHISQSKAYRAKAKAMDILESSHIEQYNMLWDYCEELRRFNPGSTVLMKVQSFNEGEMEAEDGLVQCFETAFPTQEHRSCCRHIYNNLKRRHSGILIKELFWRAAQATYIQEFEKVISELKEVDVGAHKWLEGLPLKTWTRSKFTGNAKSDALLNNMCECFNSKIIEAREKPIISLVEDIRLYLMRKFQYNREGILKIQFELCPKIRKKIFKLKQGSYKWEVAWAGEL
ncbi:hypothetical protein FCV25MIE_01284 [Fagus crenata]